jgi:hypothetical protein
LELKTKFSPRKKTESLIPVAEFIVNIRRLYHNQVTIVWILIVRESLSRYIQCEKGESPFTVPFTEKKLCEAENYIH